MEINSLRFKYIPLYSKTCCRTSKYNDNAALIENEIQYSLIKHLKLIRSIEKEITCDKDNKLQ